jgi:hypothetical protein
VPFFDNAEVIRNAMMVTTAILVLGWESVKEKGEILV